MAARDAARDEDRPAPARILADPEVQERIERSLARIREGKAEPGKTSDELLRAADEQRRLGA
jgi:hypothetical protein